MPLPTGSISLSQVNTELGLSSTTQISLNQANVRTLAGKASGAISMSDLWGKSAYAGPTSVEYLVVAGGGDGGYSSFPGDIFWGGGGGAGGFRTATGLSITAGTTYTVTVGGANSNSVFSNITNTAGGYGASAEFNVNGGYGGSGGGGAYAITGGNNEFYGAGGSGISGQGNNGGGSNQFAGAGGGGAGGAGFTAQFTPNGGGGAGTASSITGSSVTYAAGGGVAGEGNNGLNGTVNTGGGGGGGQASRINPFTEAFGGGGGSGIVVVRYADSFSAATSTTGSPTYTVSGGYRVYKFTGSGSIRWT
jgi:hypothetical protein